MLFGIEEIITCRVCRALVAYGLKVAGIMSSKYGTLNGSSRISSVGRFFDVFDVAGSVQARKQCGSTVFGWLSP
jgi:hypothetical protein